MKQYFLLLLVAATSFAHSPLRFDNYQVFRITPKSEEQLMVLKQIEEGVQGYDFWTDVAAVEKPVDIMVPPHKRYDFDDLIKLQNLTSDLIISNVQNLIDNETPHPRNQSEAFGWNRYHTLDEIYSWLKSLASKYPNVVQVVVGGRSYEGRQILGIKISHKAGNKGILIEGGIHAREWIAPATVTYIINQLLTNSDPAVQQIAQSYDWYIFPSANPDGYVYSHTSNRFWRKTRKPYGSCYGADPNRNWGYKWNHGGVSHDPCSDLYCGPSAFSEIETKSLADYISGIVGNLHIYLGFHSYSQYLLIPYGHSGLEVPENNEEMHSVGRTAMNVLAQRYGTLYEVGNIFSQIYVASGGSSDWVLSSNRKIRLCYTYELRDTGKHGFFLPPSQIIPSGEETMDSVVSIVQQAMNLRDE